MSTQLPQPVLLDICCGAGGCTRGYQNVGFYVIGVDDKPQPNYCGDEFYQVDGIDALHDLLNLEGPYSCDAIHASPPCQAFTTAGNGWKSRLGESRERHADLLTPMRGLLQNTGLPWVIENVPGAPMFMGPPSLFEPNRNGVVVCGLALGLNVKRHRWFESNVPLVGTECPPHDEDFVIVFGGGVRGRAHQIGRTTTGKGGPIIRRPTLTLERGQDAMGIDWMDRHELSQAIPPAYTEFIGEQILIAMSAREAE